MAARQASLKNASTLLPPTPIEHSCNSSLASSPTVKTAFFYKPGRGHRVGGLALNTVVCAANDGSRPQRWRSRRGNPCSAVAAPEAPQTSSKPLFDSSVLEEEYGWVSELDGGAFLDGSSRGSDSRGGKSDLQRRRWELVTALGAEARRAVLEVGDAAEAGEVREGKLGRLQKLLEVESVGEEENREDSGGVTLAEAFTLDHGGVLGEVPDSRDEAVRPSQEGRGGQKVGTPSTPDKARSQRSQKVPRALIWEGVRFGKPSVKPRAEQPANGAKQGALLVKGGSLVGEEKNEALPGTNMTESFDVDLGVEEDIEVGLESDLATLFAGTGNEAESGPLGGSSESVLLPRGAVPTSTDPLEVAPAFQQPGKINLVTSLQYQTSETFVRGSSPRTLTSTLKTGSIRKQREPSTNQKGSEPSISGGLFSEGLRTTIEPLQEPSAVFDPLLDVLEDASGAKALASIPLHQRTSKTQHVLKRRQQKALLASDEDETMLRQPWEVEEVRPKTGPPIGLELFADDRRTSSEVRARAFEPKHDKTPGGGKQWQPNKRRLYYAQKFANRWGGGETPEVENPPKEVEVLGGDVEKPPVEENHFLFPPLPRPVPHEIVNRKKVETMPVGSFRSVPPKQRKVLSMREAAAVSRGLGGRLVVPGMGSSEVTLEMREDARRGVLQQLLAATEGGLAQVREGVSEFCSA